MKRYLGLIPISSRVHKKQNRMTKFCIILAVFLVTVIFGMADMEICSQKAMAIQQGGNWHVNFHNITQEQAKIIAANPQVKVSSWYNVVNYPLEGDYLVQGKRTGICGIDEEFMRIYPACSIRKGSFPKTDSEVIVTGSIEEQLGLSVGDTLELRVPKEDKSLVLTIAGITEDTAMLKSEDAYGVFFNTSGFQKLFVKGKNETSNGVFYVQFSSFTDIPSVVKEMKKAMNLTDQQVAENVKLLGLLGMSRNSYMMQLYTTAGILAILVITAGIFMISSNLNSNLLQRTEFFGMLRCLGATKGQIIRYVHLEALNWCKTAVPFGIAGGTVVVWLLCAMLKKLSPNYFAGMKMFGISWIGIVCGAVVGIVTVLLASRSPAKRASKISPLTAITGNNNAITRRRAKINKLHVQIGLGIHHAKSSRKNLFLMVGSFSFAIVLFLTFTTAIDFMHHALKPLKPYTPDLSIISKDQTCSIDPNLISQIKEVTGIKRVYGRQFAYELPATVEGKKIKVNLISYEDRQFDWAGDSLLQGSIKEAKDTDSVLIVYDKASDITNGEIVDLCIGDQSCPLKVSGVLSDSPFSRDENIETMICSEQTFQKLTHQTGYTIIDMQVNGDITEEDVTKIREMAGSNITFSDKRMDNSEIRGGYYSLAVFMYGFLVIIALIAIINIINSIALSVSARMHQYGAMRAIGMSEQQLLHMVTAEAMTYAVIGSIVGCILGLPLNQLLFKFLVTSHWGDPWYVPVKSVTIILSVIFLGTCIAVYGPSKRIKKMSIIENISAD